MHVIIVQVCITLVKLQYCGLFHFHYMHFGLIMHNDQDMKKNTVWLEILAGRYFGGLLKICHLAEFTLAVEPGLAIMIFITKWLLKRARILIGP